MHLHKAYHQKKVLCVQKCVGKMALLNLDWVNHSGLTPADYMVSQITTDCGIFTLDLK